MPTIQAKHWRSMVSQDQYLADCFPRPPLTAFRLPKNLRELLIKAKVPPSPNQRPERRIKGIKKYGKGCTACPFIFEGKNIQISNKENGISTENIISRVIT